MRHLVFIAVLAGGALACRDTAAPAGPSLASEASDRAHLDLREERAGLIAAGDALSDAITAQGVVAGLGAALTADAIFESPRVNLVRGAAAVTSFLSTNALAPSALSWHVIAADVSSDGTRGYTWADGSSTIDFGTGATPRPTLFLIYWNRSNDGDWQVQAFVFNSGGPQPTPLPAGFGTPDSRIRRNFPNTDPSEQGAALLGVDAAFSAASVANGSGPAFEQYAAPNAIAIGAGTFVFGPGEIGEAFTGGPNDVVSWIPLFSNAAASGDLGFSVGEATFLIEGANFYSKYLTIWQKQNTGEWRFVADEGNSRPAPAP
jgi:ketosteroid isomerase-like protein